MKNKVITIVLLLSIILLIIVMFLGIEIGDSDILSISKIIEKNNEVNRKINDAAVLTTINYEESVSKLEENHKNYLKTKDDYEQISGFTTDKNNKSIFETKQYDIGYLWKKIGKYATTRNLSIAIDVKATENVKQNLYNLNFEVLGEYVNISQFITDIENDSDLYFRIYNFKMTEKGNSIDAKFTVRNVMIDPTTLNPENTTNAEKK